MKKLDEKQEQKLKDIVGLVLSIISILWSLCVLLTLPQLLEDVIVNTYYSGIVYFISYYIGCTLFSLLPAIVSIILGINNRKRHGTKISLINIIFSLISLLCCIYVLIRFLIVI